MTAAQPVRIPVGNVRFLPWAFVLIITGFVLSNLVSLYEMQRTESEVRQIARSMFDSIDLASSLSRNLYQKRILVQNHIMATQAPEMESIEAELEKVDARIAGLFEAYGPIARQEGQSAEVEALKSELAAIQPKVEEVISLSRGNRAAEARALVTKNVESSLEVINAATDNLVRGERARAEGEIALIRALQRQALIALSLLTLAGTTLALLTAFLVTRLVRQRSDELREAAALLEERNRELDAFAGRVAHDLRGPLTSISLAATLLARQSPPESRDAIVLQNGVDQMEEIIQELLTLSRIGTQTGAAACETTDVMLSVEEDLRPHVEAVGGLLRVSAEAAAVSCSKGLLRRVLWNLGENAVKYRRPEVRLELEIRGRVSPSSYELVVSDNGVGMSLRETRHVFEPFFRGERTHSIPGAGLGLSIVQRVIESCRGTVTVESTVGKGTTFRLQLPLAVSKAA